MKHVDRFAQDSGSQIRTLARQHPSGWLIAFLVTSMLTGGGSVAAVQAMRDDGTAAALREIRDELQEIKSSVRHDVGGRIDQLERHVGALESRLEDLEADFRAHERECGK